MSLCVAAIKAYPEFLQMRPSSAIVTCALWPLLVVLFVAGLVLWGVSEL